MVSTSAIDLILWIRSSSKRATCFTKWIRTVICLCCCCFCFQGLLLPLCSTGTCTLREAVIFSSVLKRTSLPVLHSAAALLRLAQMPYCGTTSFFIRVLLDKKYALPYKVSHIEWSACHSSTHFENLFETTNKSLQIAAVLI